MRPGRYFVFSRAGELRASQVPEEAREKFSLTGSRLKFLSQPPLLGSTSERPKAGGRFEQLRRA